MAHKAEVKGVRRKGNMRRRDESGGNDNFRRSSAGFVEVTLTKLFIHHCATQETEINRNCDESLDGAS